ncbi:MAG: VPLPA-CTERM sorting domain-containing protein [Planctomycetota bacterium]
MKLAVYATALLTASAAHANTTVAFDDGDAQGWTLQNSIDLQNSGGNPGGFLNLFIIDTFGINLATSTNEAFLGDYGARGGPITVSADIKTTRVWNNFVGDVPRGLVVEFRNYDLAQGGLPWTSVWTPVGTLASGTDWTTYSATIEDANATELPAGWGGYGAEDPVTFEPILPDGVTFADVLADVDEVVFTTFVPGFFFGFTNFDVGADNISIAVVPAPASAVLMGLGGLAATRRRR